MATTIGLDASGTINEKDGLSDEYLKGTVPNSIPEAEPEENEIKARVNAMWGQMNKAVPTKTLKSSSKKHSTTFNKKLKNPSKGWMAYLGLAPRDTSSLGQDIPHKKPILAQDSMNDEAERLAAAAAALSAVKEAAAAAATAAGRGKVEVTEVRDFAGQEIEVKKLVDADSKEAKGPAPSAVDAVLEQLKKKQKLSVLDKTKKDWGEFKDENKGLEEQLDAYKKSSDQYLEKVSFLQRADYREFERERDARLALQARRKPDMRENL